MEVVHRIISGIWKQGALPTLRIIRRVPRYPLIQRKFLMSGQNQIPGKGLILVVDDEALMRMGAVDVAEEAGFSVVEAGNADEAIPILESRDYIGLIITDIDMPAGSMNGLRLAAAVKRRWPPIHIIVMSGHCRANEKDLPSGAVFLSKPYLLKQLAAHIRGLAA